MFLLQQPWGAVVIQKAAWAGPGRAGLQEAVESFSWNQEQVRGVQVVLLAQSSAGAPSLGPAHPRPIHHSASKTMGPPCTAHPCACTVTLAQSGPTVLIRAGTVGRVAVGPGQTQQRPGREGDIWSRGGAEPQHRTASLLAC